MLKIPIIYSYYRIKGYKLKFCNVNENCQGCKNNLIKTTPTLIKYKNGKEILRVEEEEILGKLFEIVKE